MIKEYYDRCEYELKKSFWSYLEQYYTDWDFGLYKKNKNSLNEYRLCKVCTNTLKHWLKGAGFK